MHKLVYFPRLQSLMFLIPVFLFAAPDIKANWQGQGQSESPQAKQTSPTINEILPQTLDGGWRAITATRVFTSDQWYVLPDGKSYAEYGLNRLINRIYANGKKRVIVEVFEMRSSIGAYGLLTFNRVSLPATRKEFIQGRYLVSLSTGEKPNAGELPTQSLVDALKTAIPDENGEQPVLPSHLPAQNKIAETEVYILGPATLAKSKRFNHLTDLVNFDGGVEIVTSDYRNQNADGQSGTDSMGLTIIEYHTPQSATDGHSKVSQYLDSLSQGEKDRLILKRIGNYIVEAVDVSDRTEADKIIGQIKYTPKVYWAGRKLSDIPIDFRPPDPAAIEEATKTLTIIVRSFYWIGAMLMATTFLGVIAGGVFFYWKRYRRRKLGLDDIFGDTGETIRLNLDEFLLEDEETSIKQIGSGKK